MLIFVSIGAYVRPDLYPGTIKDVVLNLSSWSYSYNSVTWFLLPYTLISIFALYIMRIVEKFGLKLAVAVTFILYIIASYLFSRYGTFIYSYSALAVVVEYTQFLFFDYIRSCIILE